jgi:hypothetical protein
MAKRPAERFPTATAMAAALSLAVGRPSQAPATTAPPRNTSAPTVILPQRPEDASSAVGAPPMPTVRQVTAGARQARTWRWAAAGALAIGLAGAGGLLARRTTDVRHPMLASAAKPSLTTVTPTTSSSPSPRMEPSPVPSPQAAVPGGTGPERPARGGVFVLGDARVAGAVAAALRNRRCPMAASADGAAVLLRVAWDVDLRDAPFGTGAARTADYTATVDVQGPGRSRRSLDFDGHVMEVGESVTLAAARRDLATRLAEAVAAIAACRP